MEIKKVGVIGCGLMGSGIIQVCAQSGYEVAASEINEELLNKGLTAINAVLTGRVDRGKLSQPEKDATLGRIKGTTDMKDLHDCDLIIEAVSESMDLKRKIFGEMDKICPKHTILATNTSCLSIIDIAMVTTRPDKVLGLHFFNPAPVMPLLEIVRTIATSDDTIEASKNFGNSLGKTIVIAQDAPGFIVNRLMVPQLLNAIRMFESGVASKEDIDTAVNLGLNHPLGPLALADLVGLDTLLLVADSIYDVSRDTQYIAPISLQKMVSAGWLGRKTGKGFYDYQ